MVLEKVDETALKMGQFFWYVKISGVYPLGNEHRSHLRKSKIILESVFLGDMLVPGMCSFYPSPQAYSGFE